MRALAAALLVVLCLASPAAARPTFGDQLTVTVDRSTLDTRIGAHFTFTTTVSNDDDRPMTGLVAHLNVLSVEPDVYVDPEDWSSDRTRYLGTLLPDVPRTITWSIHAVNTGSLAAYVTVLPQDDAGSPPATGTAVRIHLPLETTSIFTARPLRATSSKKRDDGSATSWIGARGSKDLATSTLTLKLLNPSACPDRPLSLPKARTSSFSVMAP